MAEEIIEEEVAKGGAAALVLLAKYKIAAIVLGVLALLFAGSFVVFLVLFIVGQTDESELPTAFVYDSEGSDWSDNESIPVFYNEDFGTAKVAPYSSGSYSFVLSNTSGFALEYSIVLDEVNEYDIAMCYRLKRDGDYVVDEYSRTSDFVCSSLTIESNSTHYFELEWYWDGDVNDYNDTLAGSSGAIYTLIISVSASSAE